MLTSGVHLTRRRRQQALEPCLIATVNGAAAIRDDNCCREATRVRVVDYTGT
ncbi:hypothetical protein G155_00266 [Mycobacterium sp. VKM Ac-1817D]|jgi:hypothetical protein|nr:hypothetical protein G155_00266 [Mycobacterium sp. VKM Ac-1817D]